MRRETEKGDRSPVAIYTEKVTVMSQTIKYSHLEKKSKWYITPRGIYFEFYKFQTAECVMYYHLRVGHRLRLASKLKITKYKIKIHKGS